MPGYHREENTEKAQTNPSAQEEFVVDIDLVLHIYTTMRLTVSNCFLKTGVGDMSTWQSLYGPRNFVKAI